MLKEYTVDEFITLAKKVQGSHKWQPDWDQYVHQLKGWLKAKSKGNDYSIWLILEGIANISGKDASYWTIKTAYDYYTEMFENLKHKEDQMKIDMNKKYRRVGTHEPVRVLCVDHKTAYGGISCIGLQQNKADVETLIHFNTLGIDQEGKQIIEEIPAVDWSKVKMDTPMWMRTFTGDLWHKRHFNKFEGGRVHFWPNGYTSSTCSATNNTNSELPENCSLEEPK